MKQKNKTRLARAAMTLLFALLATVGAWAQTTVEIGDGTSADHYTPIGTLYNYSITEQLYTADEIGMAGTISSISFYYMGIAAKDLPITVYMANVDAQDLSTGISLADAEEVFSGTLSVTTTAGWVTIDLDSPFAYDGTSNLLIGINKGYVQWFSGSTWQYTSVANMARYSQNDNNAYDTSTVPGTATNNRPNIQIEITPGSGPVCNKPETLEASNVTANSAVLTWTGGSGTYNVEYKLASAEDWTSLLTNTTATSYTITDLTPGKAYQARVQSVCGEDVSGWKSVSFSTLFGIPLVEGFGTSIPTGWTLYTGLLESVMAGTAELTSATYGWNFGTGNNVFDNHARVNIYGTSCQQWLVMPSLLMEDNVQLSFEVAYTAYSGSAAPAQTGTDDKFVVLINDGQGWTVLRQWDNAGSEYVLNNLNTTPINVTLDLSSYKGKNVSIAFYGESTESNADNNLHIDNVSIDYIPACPKPTSLSVEYNGGTTATVTWESDADAWQLGLIGADGQTIEYIYSVATNSYTLTGLALGTTYRLAVHALCGGGSESEWTSPVSFTTDLCMPEDMCEITFELTDSYGDGWNGAYIDVVDVATGTSLGHMTNENLNGTTGSGTNEVNVKTLRVCDGREIQFVWHSGSFDSECSYMVTDINGDEIFSGSETMSESVDYTVNCTVTSCRKPTNLAATEIGPHSAKLSWTENGEATAWVVAYTTDGENYTELDATTDNPFTLTGLAADTDYGVKVRPVCDDSDDKWSNEINFTTLVAAPAPTNLAVTPYPTKADVTWKGFAESYDIEWAEVPAYEPSNDALWLQYDNENVVTNVGNSTVYTWTWGVMYPSSTLGTNSYLTKVAFYETSYYTSGAPITIDIYSGGDNAPGTLIATEEVTASGTAGVHVVLLSEPVTIDPTKNLWITLTTTTIDRPMAMCEVNEANGRWLLNGDEWIDLGTALSSVAAYSFMIRGFIDSTVPTYVWNSKSGVTSPYTITDLDPETQYFVRVRGNFGSDGYSNWTTTSFTTLESNPVPTDLEIDLAADGGTLTWTGYGDSYNVRYRKAVNFGDPLFFEDFENGIPSDWTTIDTDGDGYNWFALSELTTLYQYYSSIPTAWAHSGNNSAMSGSYVNGIGALTTDQYLISPKLDLQGTLRFYATSLYSDPDLYEVLLSTEGTEVSDFTITLQAMTSATYDEWDEVNIDLSAYAGQQGYIAIHHVSSDKYFLVIDDFGIYNATAAGDWTTVTSDEESFTLAGLPDGGYEYQVQSVKGQNTSEWSETGEFALLIFGDTGSHSSKMLNNLGRKAYVTLNNRMLAAGNQWNTLTLPFDLTLEGSVLEGATVETLTAATVTDGNPVHVSLTFAEAGEILEAGKPYIVKVGSAIMNPAFANVVISSTTGQTIEKGGVKFIGYFDAFDINPRTDIFYIGANNELLYFADSNPEATRTLHPFRAYFQIDGLSSAPVFSLDFGDGTTSLGKPQVTSEDGEWYTLQGMKVGKKPTTAGVYIHNGRKVVIK